MIVPGYFGKNKQVPVLTETTLRGLYSVYSSSISTWMEFLPMNVSKILSMKETTKFLHFQHDNIVVNNVAECVPMKGIRYSYFYDHIGKKECFLLFITSIQSIKEGA